MHRPRFRTKLYRANRQQVPEEWYEVIPVKNIVATACVFKSFEEKPYANSPDTYWLVEVNEDMPF